MSSLVFPENREWFNRMDADERRQFLEGERRRIAAMREEGIEPLLPHDFQREEQE